MALQAFEKVLKDTPTCVIARPRIALSAGSAIIGSADIVDYSKLTYLLVHLPRSSAGIHYDEYDSFIAPRYKFLHPGEKLVVRLGFDLEFTGDAIRKRAASYGPNYNMFSGKEGERCSGGNY
jgi:hypothetical protein